MSEDESGIRLLRRARLFTNVAYWAAVVIFALSVVYAVARVRPIVQRPVATAWERANMVINIVASSGMKEALMVFGVAVLVAMVLRLVEREEPASWAKGQDDGFLRLATLFSRTAEVVAWLCLAYLVIGIVTSTVQYSRAFAAQATGEMRPGARTTVIVQMAAFQTVSSMAYFLTLILAAYLVRALVLLSRKADAAGAGAQAQEEHTV